jgi:hypothetical protein
VSFGSSSLRSSEDYDDSDSFVDMVTEEAIESEDNVYGALEYLAPSHALLRKADQWCICYTANRLYLGFY